MASFQDRCAEFFDAADADGTGCLTRLELAKVCVQAGSGKSMEEISAWFDDMDANNDGAIGKQEFLDQLCNKVSPKDIKEADLRAAFNAIDVDGSGAITIEELQSMLEKTGQDPEMANLKSDLNDDGKVNFAEFIEMWREHYEG